MPLILRHGKGQMRVARSCGWTMEMPWGFSNSLAILASSLLGATPTEQVKPVSARMAAWMRAASTRPPSSWPPGTSVKSM